MAKANFTLDDQGAIVYKQLLDLRAERVTHALPAFDAIADDIEMLEDAVFSSQGRILGGKGWKPNSDMQRAMKAKRGLKDAILEMAEPGGIGRIRRALTREGAPFSVRRVTNESSERGTNLGIAKIHQTGGMVTLRRGKSTKTHQVKIPRRRFMQTRPTDRHRWLGYLEDQLRDGHVRLRRLS